MSNSRWTGLVFLLFWLMGGTVQSQTCQPESIPASTPDSQLQDNGDGTVTDRKTGLMWKQCPEGQDGVGCPPSYLLSTMTWRGALQVAQYINSSGGFAGFTDWRVPTIKELNSLVELQCSYPAINLTRFPNAPANTFWSSSTDVENSYIALGVEFKYGNTQGGGKASQQGLLRLVRSAP